MACVCAVLKQLIKQQKSHNTVFIPAYDTRTASTL